MLRQSSVLQGVLLVARLSHLEYIGSQACEILEARSGISGRPTVAGFGSAAWDRWRHP